MCCLGHGFEKQARALQARVIHSLARAAHAASYLGIGNQPIQVAPLLSFYPKSLPSPAITRCAARRLIIPNGSRPWSRKYKSWRKCATVKLSIFPWCLIVLNSFLADGCFSSTTEMERTSVIVHASGFKKKDATTLEAFLPPALILLFGLS